MSLKNYAIGNGQYLVVQHMDYENPPPSQPEAPEIDHVVVVDVSGSMGSELPLVREHLKQRLVKMVKPGDTLSIVWFSGRGQHGTLLTEQSLKNLLDVKETHDLIDRFLHPIGMTGFKEPLEDCKKVWEELRKKRPNALSSLLFMSDGCDNQWSHKEIFQALDQIYGKFQASTFVEYGYYADRKLLTAMAEKMGGSVVCAEDFPSFQPILEKSVSQDSPSRRFTKLETPGCKDFAFGVDRRGEIVCLGLDKWGVSVLCDAESDVPLFDVGWISDLPFGTASGSVSDSKLDPSVLSIAYAAASVYGYRMRGDVVRPLLLAIRDPSLLFQFSKCFGKQRYSEFSEAARTRAVFGGVDDKTRVHPDAVSTYYRTDLPTMFDLFDLLMKVEATAMIEHAMFRYDRITKKSVEDSGALKFKADAAEGFPITSLTLNEKRANISMLLKKNGVLSLDVPGRPKGLPKEIRAFQWRNFALVADGIVHIDLLPVRVTSEGYDRLKTFDLYKDLHSLGVIKGVADADEGIAMMLDLTKIGLTNEKLVSQPSAIALLDAELDLLRARASQKVCNHYAKLYERSSADPALAAVFGAEEAQWLQERGFKGGAYSPKKTLAESTDVYKGVELQTSIKSFNSLPKVEEILERRKNGKPLTPSMTLMAETVDLLEDLSKKMSQPHFGEYVLGLQKTMTALTRSHLMEVARRKFSILLGQTWFSEATEPGVFTVNYQGYECTVKLVDVDIEV